MSLMMMVDLAASPWSRLVIIFAIISSIVNPANGKLYRTSFENVTWDDDNWRLTTTYPSPGHYQARSSIANGYIGINLASLGPFFESDTPVDGDNIQGWPLFTQM